MRSKTRTLGAAALGAALAASSGVMAQEPIPLPVLPPEVTAADCRGGPAAVVTVPAGPVHVHRQGPIKGAINHGSWFIHEYMVGDPARFDVPPLGWSTGANFAAQAAAAEQHSFTLYRSDFFAGTERLTPDGLRRLGRMIARLGLLGRPVPVEVDPNRPGLAEARRLAVLEPGRAPTAA